MIQTIFFNIGCVAFRAQDLGVDSLQKIQTALKAYSNKKIDEEEKDVMDNCVAALFKMYLTHYSKIPVNEVN